MLWTAVAGGGFGVALVGALLIGVLESLAAGYLDPWLGGGFINIAAYLLLLVIQWLRPRGLFGRERPERV